MNPRAIPSRRWWLLAAAALGVAAGWIGRGLFDGRDPGLARTTMEREEVVDAPRLATATEGPKPEGGGGVAESIVAPTPASPSPLSKPSDRAHIEVRVTDADGAPLTRDARLYALPARQPGVDGLADCAGARLGSPIPIEVPGLYDVGVRDGPFFALREDVVVEAGANVSVGLTLPAAGRIRFRCDQSPPSAAGSTIEGRVTYEAVGPRRRYLPGRGESMEFSNWVVLRMPGVAASMELPMGHDFVVRASLAKKMRGPKGEDWALAFHEHHLHASHTIARAGDEVALSVKETGTLALHLQGHPSLSAPLTTRVVVRDGDREHVHVASVSAESVWNREVVISSGRARVSWSGRGVDGGDSVVDVRPRERVDRDILVTGDPSQSLMPVSVVLSGPGVSPTDDVTVFVREDDECAMHYLSGDNRVLPVECRGSRGAVAAIGDRLASEPFDIPLEGDLRIAFLPAGMVIVVPEERPTGGAGPLTVASHAGRLLTAFETEHDCLGTSARVTAPGMTIGPLPEGVHRFEVRLNGMRLPDAQCDVRAGRIVPLVLRR